MSWNIFRGKYYKQLDRIYKAYKTIHKQYLDSLDTENELFLAHAEILRGDLFTLGAAFDCIISEAGPQMLAKAEQEYGFIPFTSRASAEYSLRLFELSPKVKDLEYWLYKTLRGKKALSIGRGLNALYKDKVNKELMKHQEVIKEAKTIGLIKPDEEVSIEALYKISAMYRLPLGKK
jgi:hypothetical protein